jgi:phosphoribosylformylglycinamidine cyclo-ligase
MLKGAAHITGGGITGNLPRILPQGLAARIDISAWTIPPIFERLRQIGNIDPADYRRTFNLGIGMILVVAKRNVAKTRATLALLGEPCSEIGEVVEAGVVKGSAERVVYIGDAGARS